MTWGLGHCARGVAVLLTLLPLVACGGVNRFDAPWMRGHASASESRYTGPPPPVVTVQRGDTVYGIARRYGLSMKDVIRLNRLSPPYVLHVGQTLAMPRPTVHTVRRGDTLSGIARTYGVDMGTLAQANGLGPPYVIRVGEAVRLPDTTPGPAPAPRRAAPVPEVQVAEAPPPMRPTSPAPTRPSSPGAAAPEPPPQVRAVEPPEPPPRTAGTFAWPARGRLLARFGPAGEGRRNDGINIAVTAGTSVRAAESGVVVYAGDELRGFGNLLLVKHAGGWVTAYAHNAELLVRRGATVRRGQVIARAGATGNVDRPQVHFEVRRGSQAVDPLDHLERAVASN